ncbi:MAG: alpha/beta hydrolase family protein [Ardenticatenaceae bacterium]
MLPERKRTRFRKGIFSPMRLGLLVLLMMLAFGAFSTSSVHAQRVENYCMPGDEPVFKFGFADLKEEYGHWIGDPLECEHYDSEGNAYQKTTTGLLVYEKSLSRVSFVPNSWLIPDSAGPVATAEELVARYSIAALRADSYGQEGDIEMVRRMGSTSSFTRYEIAYPSDGLRIGGFMNIPFGNGPFPVVIVNHGYMPTRSYETLTYTTKYADALASAGFLVIHPNYRNHNGSDYGSNPFRVGYARDILHLIPMAQRLPQADGQKVGMWGHSMGGGITQRVLTVSDQVKAAVLYASVISDEGANRSYWRQYWRRGRPDIFGAIPHPSNNHELNVAVSPFYHLDNINAALAIHHGVRDSEVPYRWSLDLAQQLDRAGKPYDFYRYAYQDHNFTGSDLNLLNQRSIEFFRQHLLWSTSAEELPDDSVQPTRSVISPAMSLQPF